MIAYQKQTHGKTARRGWQSKFLELFPRIERQLRTAFRHLDPDAREEAVQEGIANCLQAFRRLCEQRRDDRAFASSLAGFAIRQVNGGRQVGCRLNIRDPLSRHAQRSKGIRVQRLEQYQNKSGEWVNAFVEDRRASIPDQVAIRIDVPAWLQTLSRRARAIAKDLAVGCLTSELAKKYRLSPGRISQMRKELRDSWFQFQGATLGAPSS